MEVMTVFTCETCGGRIKYDTEAKCYLNHSH